MHRRDYLATAGTVAAAVTGGAGVPVSANQGTTTLQSDQFELVSLEAPGEVGVMRPFTYSFTIANRGDDAREFWDYLTVGTPVDEGERRIGLQIPAGEEVTVERNTAHAPYVGPYRFSFTGFDDSFEIEATPAYRELTQAWRSPNDTVLRVDEIEFTDSYEYEDFDGDVAEESASEGAQWALVWLYARNEAPESTRLPASRNIGILAEDQQFTEAFIRREAGRYESDDVSPGIEREGWIAYEVPEELGPEDVEIDYTDDDFEGEWSARWVTDVEE